jgi:hypothetical protein
MWLTRLTAAAIVVCHSLVWVCPAVCSTSHTGAPVDDSSRVPTEHHHQHSGHRSNASGGSLTNVHCDDCAPGESPALSAAKDPSPRLILLSAAVLQTRDGITMVEGAQPARPPLIENSPPSGILPLRI